MSRRSELVDAAVFGLVVAAVCAAAIGVRATHAAQTTADEPQYLLSALSLWEDGDLDISDELADGRYLEFHEVALPQQTLLLEDGRRISPHDPLLPILLAAPMGIGGWVGAKALLALLGGATAALGAWTARNRFGVSRGVAHTITGLFALAPPLAVYSTQVYPEIPAALATLAGFSAVVEVSGRRARIVLAVAVVALPWLAVKYVPIAATLSVIGLLRADRQGRRVLLAVFAASAAIYVAGHLAIYGGLTAYATGDHFVGGEFTAVGADVDLWGRSTRVLGLLVDRGFGVAMWQPAFLLLPLVVGWAASSRHRGHAPALAVLGVGWLVATFVALTMHGWWYPGRQIVVVVPVAAVLVAAWVQGSARIRLPASVVLGSAGIVAFAFLVAEGLTGRLTAVVDFGATANPLYGALAAVAPDYMTVSPATWVAHGSWVVVSLVLAWIGWRSGARVGGSLPPSGRRSNEEERVST